MYKIQFRGNPGHSWLESVSFDGEYSEDQADALVSKSYNGLEYRKVPISPVPISPAPPPAIPHYQKLTPEPIEVIEAWSLNFYRANVLKYVARAGTKDPTKEGTIRDLEKAISYLRREINSLSGKPGW